MAAALPPGAYRPWRDIAVYVDRPVVAFPPHAPAVAKLYNRTACAFTFKLRAAGERRYKAAPCAGLLPAGGGAAVEIQCLDDEGGRAQDRFELLVRELSGREREGVEAYAVGNYEAGAVLLDLPQEDYAVRDLFRYLWAAPGGGATRKIILPAVFPAPDPTDGDAVLSEPSDSPSPLRVPDVVSPIAWHRHGSALTEPQPSPSAPTAAAVPRAVLPLRRSAGSSPEGIPSVRPAQLRPPCVSHASSSPGYAPSSLSPDEDAHHAASLSPRYDPSPRVPAAPQGLSPIPTARPVDVSGGICALAQPRPHADGAPPPPAPPLPPIVFDAMTGQRVAARPWSPPGVPGAPAPQPSMPQSVPDPLIQGDGWIGLGDRVAAHSLTADVALNGRCGVIVGMQRGAANAPREHEQMPMFQVRFDDTTMRALYAANLRVVQRHAYASPSPVPAPSSPGGGSVRFDAPCMPPAPRVGSEETEASSRMDTCHTLLSTHDASPQATARPAPVAASPAWPPARLAVPPPPPQWAEGACQAWQRTVALLPPGSHDVDVAGLLAAHLRPRPTPTPPVYTPPHAWDPVFDGALEPPPPPTAEIPDRIPTQPVVQTALSARGAPKAATLVTPPAPPAFVPPVPRAPESLASSRPVSSTAEDSLPSFGAIGASMSDAPDVRPPSSMAESIPSVHHAPVEHAAALAWPPSVEPGSSLPSRSSPASHARWQEVETEVAAQGRLQGERVKALETLIRMGAPEETIANVLRVL